MKRLLKVILAVTAISIAVGITWRWFSRHYRLPCPTWLAWLLENPLIETVAGTQATLDRIDPQPGERCLDVGSGPGRLTIPAARRVGPTGTVVALDVQPAMLARLERRTAEAGVSNVVIHLGDIASDVRLSATSFDRAWLATVLGEIPDREAALSNIYRLLRPGGTLSVTEIFPDPHYQRRRVVLRLGTDAGFVPTHFWSTVVSYTQNFIKP